MPTTANRGYRYPASTDNTQIWQHIQNTASDIDADVAAQLAAWTPYVPVWSSSGTAPALGNGTITGYYKQLGKTVHVAVRIVFGSTTTFGTGGYSFTLPVTAATNINRSGSANLTDVSAGGGGHYTGATWLSTATPTVFTCFESSTHVQLAPTAPVVWANTDFFEFTITYEAA